MKARAVRQAIGEIAGWPDREEIIAAALAEERGKARAVFEEAIDAVLAYCEEIDQAALFPGLADTDAIRTRLSTVDVAKEIH